MRRLHRHHDQRRIHRAVRANQADQGYRLGLLRHCTIWRLGQSIFVDKKILTLEIICHRESDNQFNVIASVARPSSKFVPTLWMATPTTWARHDDENDTHGMFYEIACDNCHR